MLFRSQQLRSRKLSSRLKTPRLSLHDMSACRRTAENVLRARWRRNAMKFPLCVSSARLVGKLLRHKLLPDILGLRILHATLSRHLDTPITRDSRYWRPPGYSPTVAVCSVNNWLRDQRATLGNGRCLLGRQTLLSVYLCYPSPAENISQAEHLSLYIRCP